MILFNYLIFPGFLFSAIAGLIASWIDRKVTARVQWRVGPPWYQGFADFIKLLGKETILPCGNKVTFLFAPIVGLIAVSLVATILGRLLINPAESFLGDLIVVLYLLIIPAISIILGASASNNPLASLGASREMKMVLAYELPFILAVATVIIKAGNVIGMGQILAYQVNNGAIAGSISGVLAFIVSILCMQAKLGLVPFDASEAEQEIMAGVFIEYSGFLLAIFKLMRSMLLYVMPLFLVCLFWIANINIYPIIGKYVVLLVIIILIKNTNPRLRIDQALRFFWGPVSALAVIAVILALLGL
ncbi:MAG: NADH-quinone oxidoreductase subunit H [Candidatus Omnitrophica bacterium]|nr:NADH-quinone oxidoreductase subunit H [Candidatus Omnitrophota bacterium]